MVSILSIDSQVTKILSKKYKEDQEFRQNLDYLYFFYGRKYLHLATDDSQKKYIEDNLFDMIKSQFYQGYYIMREILNDPSIELDEQIWSANKGIIRNELPILMENVFEDSKDTWFLSTLGKKIGMMIMQKINDVYEVIQQTRKDAALYGVYQAFIDDKRYQPKKSNENHSLLLGDPFDLHFLNPQIYMKAQYITDEQEIWDIYTWSTFKGGVKWVGSIQLSKIPSDIQMIYLLQFTVNEIVSDFEKYEILENALKRLSDEVKALTQIRICHAKDLEIVMPKDS